MTRPPSLSSTGLDLWGNSTPDRHDVPVRNVLGWMTHEPPAPDRPIAPADLADGELIDRVRAGDESAYGLLFARHRGSASASAARIVGESEADDVVAEAFERILVALRRGEGPRLTFRPYLLATVNNAAVDRLRRIGRQIPVDPAELAPLFTESDGAQLRAEHAVLRSALASLPPRWQQVLWLCEVERVPHAEVGALLDLSSGAVSQLALRARRGLTKAYVDQHSGLDEPATWRADLRVLLLPLAATTLGAGGPGDLGPTGSALATGGVSSGAKAVLAVLAGVVTVGLAVGLAVHVAPDDDPPAPSPADSRGVSTPVPTGGPRTPRSGSPTSPTVRATTTTAPTTSNPSVPAGPSSTAPTPSPTSPTSPTSTDRPTTRPDASDHPTPSTPTAADPRLEVEVADSPRGAAWRRVVVHVIDAAPGVKVSLSGTGISRYCRPGCQSADPSGTWLATAATTPGSSSLVIDVLPEDAARFQARLTGSGWEDARAANNDATVHPA